MSEFKTHIGENTSEDSDAHRVHLAEDSQLVKTLLDIVYPGRHPLNVPSFEFATELAAAGEKYDIPDVASFVRNEILKSTFPGSALETYVFACQRGWMDDARIVSSRTLKVDLRSENARRLLKRLDGASLLKLLDFHRAQQELVIAAMDLEYNTPSLAVQKGRKLSWSALTTKHTVGACQSTEHDTVFWTALKFHISQELQSNADGDLLRSWEFWGADRFTRLWENKCPSCRRPFFKKHGFISEFSRVLDNLPETVLPDNPEEAD